MSDDNQTTDGGIDRRRGQRLGRRRYLAGVATTAAAGLAGCFGFLGDDGDDDEGELDLLGSGPGGRPSPGGTPMADLPALSGTLTVYSGRSNFLVDRLVTFIEDKYDDFQADVRYGGSTDLVNTILNEGSGTPADVFFSVNAGALGTLADQGRTRALSDPALEMVPAEFRADTWIGTSGRIRSVPYNTSVYDAADLPSDIMAYEDFDGDLGWAPGYGSCQAFVTAMRLLEGEQRTRQWLEGVLDNGIRTYPNEFDAAQAVADGEIDAAFTNHYYIQRVLDGDPDATIATTFTEGDAGATFNVAGAAVVDETGAPNVAESFVRHLLSAEAQEYFAIETFEYPLIPGVEPVGDLPSVDELNVPDIDITKLSDLEPTVDLMRDVGITL